MRAREAGLWALSWGSAIAVCAALGGLLSFLLARGVPTLGPALLFGSTPPMEAILALKPVCQQFTDFKKLDKIVIGTANGVDRGGEYDILTVDPSWANLPDDEPVHTS